ncbi:ABC transporter substrate binding protein [Pontibacterium granulatum]|uniref:ABC transporter substrate-binding protein n=1 Tax=Pontibacterium granulatum TaxID=2036029 RepID=UPI00249AFE40|nr:ABC transporter substrate binding protein [Pontibacterium granulatum]MDI3323916.1 ABC transporter substrate binding protein [Pontibacterium granulatum]
MALAPPNPIRTVSILRRLSYSLLFALTLFITVSPEASARPLVVLSDSTTSYQKVLNTLREVSSIAVDHITADTLEAFPDQLQQETYDYYISVGSRATDTLLKHLPQDAPAVIATFIPRRSYQSLLRAYDTHPVVIDKRISAIYLDQPYDRQLRLARLISPRADVIGAAFSDLSARDLPLLEETLNETGLTLEYRVLDEDQNPIKQLQPLLEKSDIFLTLPDKAVFNRSTAKWILYISFRLRVPLLGFSRKYVEAGAVAGIYSSADQIGRQTGELMAELNLDKRVLPPAQYPMYFSVATNPSAAKRLRIRIPAKAVLEQSLKEAEQ